MFIPLSIQSEGEQRQDLAEGLLGRDPRERGEQDRHRGGAEEEQQVRLRDRQRARARDQDRALGQAPVRVEQGK